MEKWLSDLRQSYREFVSLHDKYASNNKKIIKEYFKENVFKRPFNNTRTSYAEAKKVYEKTGNIQEAYKRYTFVNDSIAASNRNKLKGLKQPTFAAIKEMNK